MANCFAWRRTCRTPAMDRRTFQSTSDKILKDPKRFRSYGQEYSRSLGVSRRWREGFDGFACRIAAGAAALEKQGPADMSRMQYALKISIWSAIMLCPCSRENCKS